MKNRSYLSVLASVVTSTLFAGLVSAGAQDVNFQNYNAIIFNNLSTTTDIQGRTFVGNDFTGTGSATLGTRLQNKVGSTDQSFIVGGNLAAGSWLNVQAGSLYLGGSRNSRPINFNGGGSVVASTGIADQLASIQSYSIAQSVAMQDMVADSIATYPTTNHGPTKFNATAGSDGVAVFHVSGADIFSNPYAQQFELIADSLTKNVVINVSGTNIDWTGGNMVGQFTTDYWQAHVVWNFFEAETINLGSRNFNGAILAPYASITSSGPIDGLVVANNLTTTGAVNLPDGNSATPYAYDGYAAPVPEPGSAVFLIAAAGMILIARNRRLMV